MAPSTTSSKKRRRRLQHDTSLATHGVTTVCSSNPWRYNCVFTTPLTTKPSTTSITKETMVSRAFFVYGTLHPDDTSNAPWTQPFNQGMDSVSAGIFGLRLYRDAYPLVISPDPSAKQTGFVVGHVLTLQKGTDWKQKLAEANSIEGYPDYYSRKVVKLDESTSLAVFSQRCQSIKPNSPTYIIWGLDPARQPAVNWQIA